jgi:chitinase
MAAPLVMTYFVDWAPRSNMNYDLFDSIDFAFALPNAEFNLIFDTADAPSLLRKLVAEAHASSTLVKLSIGGWTGSQSVIPLLFLRATNRL